MLLYLILDNTEMFEEIYCTPIGLGNPVLLSKAYFSDASGTRFAIHHDFMISQQAWLEEYTGVLMVHDLPSDWNVKP
jgi:hypothetical protein